MSHDGRRRRGRSAARASARERAREIGWTIAVGMTFTLLLVFALMLFEHSFLARQIELLTYNLVQHRLSLPDGAPLDIAIVDISDVHKEPGEGGEDVVTSRDALQEIVEAVVAQGPKAVAVDVDFSATGGRYATPLDPIFFEYCLNAPVPIFVGIHLSLAEPRDLWLGVADYARLGATIAAPVPERDLFTTRMPVSVRVPPLKTESRSLAAATTGRLVPELKAWQRPFVSVVEEVEVPKADRNDPEPLLAIDEFIVNYAPLRALQRQKINAATRIDIDNATVRPLLEGKYVFIGTAQLAKTRGLDVFALPEIGLVPGVFVHASAAYTLLHAPLLLLKAPARFAFDILSSLIVFSIVGWIDYRFGARDRVATERLRAIFTALTVAAVVLVGGWLVPYTRLFWPDFILVAISAIVHGPVEHATLTALRWLGPRLRAATGAVVFEADKEAHR